MSKLVVFDLETTPIHRSDESHSNVHIFQIALRYIQANASGDCFTKISDHFMLSKPVIDAVPDAMQPENAAYTHVKLSSISSAEPFDPIAVAKYMNGAKWIGHNIVGFDCLVVLHAFARLGYQVRQLTPIPSGMIDTMLLASFARDKHNIRLLGPWRSLRYLAQNLYVSRDRIACDSFGDLGLVCGGDGRCKPVYDLATAHEADADVASTHGILSAYAALLGPGRIAEFEEATSAQYTAIAACARSLRTIQNDDEAIDAVRELYRTLELEGTRIKSRDRTEYASYIDRVRIAVEESISSHAPMEVSFRNKKGASRPAKIQAFAVVDNRTFRGQFVESTRVSKEYTLAFDAIELLKAVDTGT